MNTFTKILLILALVCASGRAWGDDNGGGVYNPNATGTATVSNLLTAPFPLTPNTALGVDGTGTNVVSVTNVLATDPTVAAFLNAAAITDQSAAQDLNAATADSKQLGCWTNRVETVILEPRFNPQAHIAFQGGNFTWSAGENYTAWGAWLAMTNYISATLPIGISNCTVAITMRLNPNDIDTGLYSVFGAPNKIGTVGLYSAVDGSSFQMAGYNDNNSFGLFDSAGTNWLFNGNTALVLPTNCMAFNNCGSYYYTWQDPILREVYLVSINSNGLMQCYRDGVQGAFCMNANYRSNVLTGPIPTSAFDHLVIGGTPSWTNNLANTNYQGEAALVQVFNQSCDQNPNIPVAAFRFSLFLETNAEALVLNGSSRINYKTQSFNSAQGLGIDMTNDQALLYQQQNPDTYVIDNAFPGNFLVHATNAVVSGNGTPLSIPGMSNYINPIIYFPQSKYKKRTTISCWGDNDVISAGLTPDGAAKLFDKVNRPLVQNSGVTLVLFRRGAAWNAGVSGASQAGNLLAQAYWNDIETNCNDILSGIIYEDKSLTREYLAVVGVDTVHVGMTNTPMGHLGAAREARMWKDHLPYPSYSGGTNNIGLVGTPGAWTNIFPYTVIANVTGGAVTGIAKNGNTVSTNTVALASVRMAPGDVLTVTNTIVPELNIDSTQ